MTYDNEDTPYYKPRKEDGTPEDLMAALVARLTALEAKVALIEKVVGGFGPPPQEEKRGFLTD